MNSESNLLYPNRISGLEPKRFHCFVYRPRHTDSFRQYQSPTTSADVGDVNFPIAEEFLKLLICRIPAHQYNREASGNPLLQFEGTWP